MDLANLGYIDKLVDKTLTVNLGQDSALVVVPGKKFVHKRKGTAIFSHMVIFHFSSIFRFYIILSSQLLRLFLFYLPESPAHGLVVHVRLVLVHAPQPRHCLAVHQLEDSRRPVGPLDELGATFLILGY